MTKDPSQIFDEWLNIKLTDIHTIMPGQIESYDEQKRKAEVKPLIKVKMFNNADVEIKNISNVPVIFPGSNDFNILFPLKKGDGVLLLFAESGIGKFLSSGNVSEADSQHKFQLADCIAIPGLWAFPKVPQDKSYIKYKEDGSIEIKSNKGKIKIDGTTDIEINGNSKNFVTHAELTQSLNTFLIALNAHTHTCASPGSPSSAPVTSMTLNIESSKTNTVKTG